MIRFRPILLVNLNQLAVSYRKVGMIFVSMRVVMVHVVPTGHRIHSSTARLPLITTAVLPKYYSSPKVSGELGELLVQRHGLVHIRQKIGNGWRSHTSRLSTDSLEQNHFKRISIYGDLLSLKE
jgi:hypothetical protein